LTSADVPAELIEKERAVAAGKAEEDRKAAEAAGKPAQSAEIVAKRIEGGVQKYLKEVSLFNQVSSRTTSRPWSRCSRPPAPR
jgi:elongation factor Ts